MSCQSHNSIWHNLFAINIILNMSCIHNLTIKTELLPTYRHQIQVILEGKKSQQISVYNLQFHTKYPTILKYPYSEFLLINWKIILSVIMRNCTFIMWINVQQIPGCVVTWFVRRLPFNGSGRLSPKLH